MNTGFFICVFMSWRGWYNGISCMEGVVTTSTILGSRSARGYIRIEPSYINL